MRSSTAKPALGSLRCASPREVVSSRIWALHRRSKLLRRARLIVRRQGPPPAHPPPEGAVQWFGRKIDVVHQLGSAPASLENDLARVECLELGAVRDAHERHAGPINQELHEL